MAVRLTTPLLDDSGSKPIRGRVDYDLYNYCANCSIKYPKNIQRCLDCRQKVRTKPWHRSKVIRWKRI